MFRLDIYSILMLQTALLHGLLFDSISDVVTVTSPVGTVVGTLKPVTFDGYTYKIKEYLGIPYAEPPTRNRRFQKPVPKANFTHSFHAFDYGPPCLQKKLLINLKMSEDCLFLNIFAPERSNGSSLFPVMIWIHGGWFQAGSSSSYDGKILSAFADIVVVTLNYRLAHLGFLRVDEEEGNFGLWDQHLAIKWVKDNIAAFGGDINNITIFGESAGSVGVVYQSLFPKNKGLFQRSIAQSGSLTSQWGFSTNKTATRQFNEFSTSLNCSGTHTQIMTCLRQKSSNEVENAIGNTDLYDVVLPNRDKDFVPQNPIDMLKDQSASHLSHEFFRSLDFLTGSTSTEGALFLFYFSAELNANQSGFQSNYDQLTIPRIEYETKFIPGILADVFDNVDTIPQVIKDVTIFEYTNWNSPDDDRERLVQLLDLATHAAVLAPTISTVQLHVQGTSFSSNTYLYQFATHANVPGQLSIPSYLEGPEISVHGADLPFTWGFSGLSNITHDNIRTSKAIMTMWSNFAKSGNPNLPRNITEYLPTEWPRYTMTSQNYLRITSSMTAHSVKQNIEAKKMQLWLKYLPSLFP